MFKKIHVRKSINTEEIGTSPMGIQKGTNDVNYGCRKKIDIYAPMIYTALCIMFLMRADTLRGDVGGGWALEMQSFLGPVKWHQDERRVPYGPKKFKTGT
jgi:hypothetical protein